MSLTAVIPAIAFYFLIYSDVSLFPLISEEHVVRTCDADGFVKPRLDGLIADHATGGSKMFAA